MSLKLIRIQVGFPSIIRAKLLQPSGKQAKSSPCKLEKHQKGFPEIEISARILKLTLCFQNCHWHSYRTRHDTFLIHWLPLLLLYQLNYLWHFPLGWFYYIFPTQHGKLFNGKKSNLWSVRRWFADFSFDINLHQFWRDIRDEYKATLGSDTMFHKNYLFCLSNRAPFSSILLEFYLLLLLK